MINILLGAPGGGKSYEATVFHVLAALAKGRKVITNLPLHVDQFAAIDSSYPALIELRTKTLKESPDMDAVGRDGRAFANIEDFADTWKHPKHGFGPLYVIDECHKVFPRLGTPVLVQEWFAEHRHTNADVLLMTQSTGKIDQSIKDLIQVCYKVRKATAFGKSESYIRKVLDGVNGGEIATSERKYEPKFFKLYRSHTAGNAVAELTADDVAPLLVKWKRGTRIFWVFTLIVCVWAFWPSGKKPSKPVVADSRTQALVTSAKAEPFSPCVEGAHMNEKEECVLDVPDGKAAGTEAALKEVVETVPEPFTGKLVHLSGSMKMGTRDVYTFTVSANGQRIMDITSDQLREAGYRWQPLTHCIGVLRYEGKAYPITCDAPVLAAGTKEMPVVIAEKRPKESAVGGAAGL
jgi:zona occludens toxin